jgi:hypothetical protein
MKGRHFDMIVDNQKKVRAQLTIITDDEFLRRMPGVLKIFRPEPILSFGVTLDQLSSFKLTTYFSVRTFLFT